MYWLFTILKNFDRNLPYSIILLSGILRINIIRNNMYPRRLTIFFS